MADARACARLPRPMEFPRHIGQLRRDIANDQGRELLGSSVSARPWQAHIRRIQIGTSPNNERNVAG